VLQAGLHDAQGRDDAQGQPRGLFQSLPHKPDVVVLRWVIA
jgi:hypothetical protein